MGQPWNYHVAEDHCRHPALRRVTFFAPAHLGSVHLYFVLFISSWHWTLAGLRHLVVPLPPSAIEIFSDR